MNNRIEIISPSDRLAQAEVDRLLKQEGIARDPFLDHTVGLYDAEERLIATGSCYANTLRCLAVDSAHRGEGFMSTVVSHLLKVQAERGHDQVFLYTKPENAALFADLGFSEIAGFTDLVFMEYPKNRFDAWVGGIRNELESRLPKLSGKRKQTRLAAVVMNANPFTLGHRYLLEQASKENDRVVLFLLSEENGPIPYAVRKKLTEEGIAGLSKVILIPSGAYLISRATFPSYFLKSEEKVIRAHAELDATLFSRMANAVGITKRVVGEEPSSFVTSLYNEILVRELPENGIECRVVPRLLVQGKPVSASTVRQAIQDGQLETVRDLLPESTYRYFLSEEAAPIVQAIREAGDVRHY